MQLPRGVAPSVAAVWSRYPFARVAVIVLATYNVALGVVLAVSGPSRVSTASFSTIREYGGPIVWGAGLFVVGAGIFASTLISRTGIAWGLAAAAVVHLFLAGGFVVAALDSPQAAATGPLTYAAIAACHAVQWLVHRAPRSRAAR